MMNKHLRMLMLLCLAALCLCACGKQEHFADTSVAADRATVLSADGLYEYAPLDDGSAVICGYRGTGRRLDIPTMIDGCTVTAICDYAFADNHQLRDVTIPPSVTRVGKNPFSGCISLLTVTVAQEHPTLCIRDRSLCTRDGRLICYPVGRSAPVYEVPEGIWLIDDYAFRMCGALRRVYLPQSLEIINSVAFMDCGALEHIGFPAGLRSIESFAFAGCRSLVDVTLPDKLAGIGERAFEGCTSLRHVEIPGSVQTIGAYAFYRCSSLISARIALGVEKIGDYAFASCTSLQRVMIPDVGSGIGALAYRGERAEIRIGECAFSACRALESIVLPARVAEIGADAFFGSGTTIIVYSGTPAAAYCKVNELNYRYADRD